ncbi:hypothetical protein L195_g048980, partial [Trifolium pratense]
VKEAADQVCRDGDLHMQSTYNHHDSGSSMNNWGAPVAPGVGGYGPIPPTPHGRFPGPGHSPTVSPNDAPYSLSTIATIHPTAAFAADAYCVSGLPERSKKVITF